MSYSERSRLVEYLKYIALGLAVIVIIIVLIFLVLPILIVVALIIAAVIIVGLLISLLRNLYSVVRGRSSSRSI
ncbi:MAG: hypothetical protein GXO26_07165 [Crenarchaeota archaeon]|nr:hypothetical protein [Thermoproteota archaeon]